MFTACGACTRTTRMFAACCSTHSRAGPNASSRSPATSSVGTGLLGSRSRIEVCGEVCSIVREMPIGVLWRMSASNCALSSADSARARLGYSG